MGYDLRTLLDMHGNAIMNAPAGGDMAGSTVDNLILIGTANSEGVIRAQRRDQLAVPAANLAMAGFRHTGIGDGVLATDSAAFGQLWNGWIADPNTWTVRVCPTVSGGTSTIATSRITMTAHGLTAGMFGIISGLATTTGIFNGSGYYVLVVDANTIQLANIPGGTAITFGGTLDTGTIVFTGQNQFTIPIDATSYIGPGTLVSYNDGAVDMGVVRSAVNASGTTTVTLASTIDYAIANATLTAPRFSNTGPPLGFPADFGYAGVMTGSGQNGASKYRYSTRGRKIRLDMFQFSTATSSAAAHFLSSPVSSAVVAGMAWFGMGQPKDNNVVQQAGFLTIGSNASAVTVNGLFTTSTNSATGLSSMAGFIEFAF